MSTAEHHAAQPPVPDSTPDELVARTRALRPQLVAEHAATEERTCYSADIGRGGPGLPRTAEAFH